MELHLRGFAEGLTAMRCGQALPNLDEVKFGTPTTENFNECARSLGLSAGRRSAPVWKSARRGLDARRGVVSMHLIHSPSKRARSARPPEERQALRLELRS